MSSVQWLGVMPHLASKLDAMYNVLCTTVTDNDLKSQNILNTRIENIDTVYNNKIEESLKPRNTCALPSHALTCAAPIGEGKEVQMGREILYTTTSWKQLPRLRDCVVNSNVTLCQSNSWRLGAYPYV